MGYYKNLATPAKSGEFSMKPIWFDLLPKVKKLIDRFKKEGAKRSKWYPMLKGDLYPAHKRFDIFVVYNYLMNTERGIADSEAWRKGHETAVIVAIKNR